MCLLVLVTVEPAFIFLRMQKDEANYAEQLSVCLQVLVTVEPAFIFLRMQKDEANCAEQLSVCLQVLVTVLPVHTFCECKSARRTTLSNYWCICSCSPFHCIPPHFVLQ